MPLSSQGKGLGRVLCWSPKPRLLVNTEAHFSTVVGAQILELETLGCTSVPLRDPEPVT